MFEGDNSLCRRCRLTQTAATQRHRRLLTPLVSQDPSGPRQLSRRAESAGPRAIPCGLQVEGQRRHWHAPDRSGQKHLESAQRAAQVDRGRPQSLQQPRPGVDAVLEVAGGAGPPRPADLHDVHALPEVFGGPADEHEGQHARSRTRHVGLLPGRSAEPPLLPRTHPHPQRRPLRPPRNRPQLVGDARDLQALKQGVLKIREL